VPLVRFCAHLGDARLVQGPADNARVASVAIPLSR
jgi:hypothetical protein